MHDVKSSMRESGVAALATDEEAKARTDEIRNLIVASRTGIQLVALWLLNSEYPSTFEVMQNPEDSSCDCFR